MIPSLLQIPSAVSDSKLHSVLPNNGKGDFTFDRSTGATRINRDGLIEEVGYFSSELVQNGDFSELGSELIVNGDFATDSDWTLTQATISNGVARFATTDGSFAGIRQNVFTVGKTYLISLDVSDLVGTAEVNTNGGTSIGLEITTNGTKSFYMKAENTDIEIKRKFGVTNASATIDNVSVKQVDPNDRWTLGTGWSYGENKAIFNTSSNSSLVTNINISVGKLYKLIIDGEVTGGGGLKLSNSSGLGQDQVISLPFNQELTHDGGLDTVEIRTLGASQGFITNISVIEIQGDRPRLSYDITNGVVEDKPHLLLEPSATNLFTFSEDFSQSAWGKGDAQILSATHKNPDGTTNANVLAYNGGTNQHYMQFTPSVSSGQNYTFSIFLKAKELKYVCLIFLNNFGGRYFDLENGTLLGTAGSGVDDSKIEDFGNGWYRCSITDSATSTTKFSGVYLSENGTSIGPHTPTTTNGVYVWGAMFEQQSYATSYIPTAGTTITRAAETCNNSKPSVNSTEGVLYAEIQALNLDGGLRYISIGGSTDTNRLVIRFLNTTGNISAFSYPNGAITSIMEDTSTNPLVFNKVAMKWKVNDFALWVNGNEVSTDTSGATFASGVLDRVQFSNPQGTSIFYGKVKGLAVYNEALSESQLMQLTGVTATSIYDNFVTRTASFTVEALNEVKKVIDNL